MYMYHLHLFKQLSFFFIINNDVSNTELMGFKNSWRDPWCLSYQSSSYQSLTMQMQARFRYFRELLFYTATLEESSWSWSHGSWIYYYLCNQCLSQLSCEFEHRSWWGVLNTTLCDQVCQWLATGHWFSPVSSTNKTYCHDITEILLKVVFNTINLEDLTAKNNF